MNASESDVTVTTSIIDRLTATISREWHNIWHNEEIHHSITIARQQAHDWYRTAPRPCPTHGIMPYWSIVKAQEIQPKTPEEELQCYVCHFCKIEHDRDAIQLPPPRPISSSPNYSPGSVFLAVNAKAQEYKQQLINSLALSRVPTLPTKLATIPTGPLPARDIERANTVLDLDATQPRIRAISMSTKQIPAMRAEVLFHEIMYGPVHERGTGEQERIEDGAFLL